MSRKSWFAWALLAHLGALSGGMAQDPRPPAPEIARLLSESRAPRRFKDHKPEFEIRPQKFTFEVGGRKFEETYYAVLDGSKLVALCDPYSNQVEILAATPELAPTKVELTAPLGSSAQRGTRLKPEIRLGGAILEIDQRDCNFSKEEMAVAVVFRQEWALPRKGHSTSVFRFRCDPVRGYTVEIGTQVTLAPQSSKKPPAGDIIGVLSVKPARLESPWPGACEFDRTVYTPRSAPDYAGWGNNLASATRIHGRDEFLPLRVGGFLAYLGSKPGWIPAISYPDTTSGVPLQRIDPVTLEQQCYLVRQPSAEEAQPGPLLAMLEFTSLPPEAGEILSQKVNLTQWDRQNAVMVRLGRVEDFEDQPLPLASGTRGLVSAAYVLSTREAHSGKNSIILLGTPANRQPVKPQVSAPAVTLDARTRYRVSVWAKAVSGVTEGLVSVTLHSGAGLQDEAPRRLRTLGAKTGDGWKELTLEIETGPLPAFADLRFQAIGNGSVHFDDFSFTRLTP